MTKTLIVIGDSYSTPNFCVEPENSFWGLAAKDLNVDSVINYSHSGLPLDLVLHVLLNEKFDWLNSYFIVGIPPLARVGLFVESNTAQRHQAQMFDKNFESWPVGCNSLTNCCWEDYATAFANGKYFLSRYNHSWQELMSLEKILLAHAFLKSRGAEFIIANLTVPILLQEDWEIGSTTMTASNQLPECILFKDTLFDVNKRDNIKPVDRDPTDPDCWFGHHGAEGNANWYQKVLLPKMKELKWL